MEDIIESIELIESYVENMDFGDFKKDRKTVDAVVRNFEIIGEAARNIPDNIKAKYTDIDWKGMIGLRNRIAHGYFGISITIIWEILKRELPPLKEKMKQILEKGEK
ncbi:MAG: DUF86 domain-containing protein [Thermoplasmata archaeon]